MNSDKILFINNLYLIMFSVNDKICAPNSDKILIYIFLNSFYLLLSMILYLIILFRFVN